MSTLSQGRVVARREWNPGLFTLSVEAEVAPFVPGQFLNLGLMLDGQMVRRAYSLASAPGAHLEFYVTEVSGGALTPALVRLEPGAALWVDPKPQGFFTLDWVPPAEELWMVATGTGLGPFISMLRAGEALRRFQRVVVVHGTRHAAELAYAEEIAALAVQHPGRVARVPVVSRDPQAPDALHGRITQALATGELEERAGVAISPERSHLMLCGNPAMIDELLALLAARGLNRHRTRKPGHITVERYWD